MIIIAGSNNLREFFAQMHKTAVVSCVELILMQFSNTKYHTAVASLRAYDTAISEVYDRTEYLKIVLKDTYGSDYAQIIDDIKACLGDLVKEDDIAKFFKILES